MVHARNFVEYAQVGDCLFLAEWSCGRYTFHSHSGKLGKKKAERNDGRYSVWPFVVCFMTLDAIDDEEKRDD